MWKIRSEKIVYGLIYPAFFGNMVYDFIKIIFANPFDLKSSFSDQFLISLLIILYVIVDYIHLNADVNRIYCRAEFKNLAYFLCDIFTPTILFLAFVLLNDTKYFNFGIILFALVPWVILIWKFKNPNSRYYFIVYGVLSIAVGILLFTSKSVKLDCVELYFLGSTAFYIIYAFIFYPKKSMQFDLDEVQKLKIKYNLECPAGS